jgi:uncharacterized protein (DUF2147 family)
MKRLSFLVLVFSLFLGGFSAKSQSKADKICGIYYATEPTSGEGSQVLIYKTADGKYEGKVIWMQHPNRPDGTPLRDARNPDKSKRDQTCVGMVIIKDFVYNEKDEEWQGSVYNPGNGSTYRSYMRLEAGGTLLKVRGYLGISLLGKTVVWKRETERR